MEDILKKLISFPTVQDNPEASFAALDYIEAYLTERGMFVHRFVVDGYPSLLAETKPNHKTPVVMLAAHCDVVRAPPELMKLRKENGKYLGRGVFDMKFAIAVYMQLVDDLRDSVSAHDFAILITCDEEKGTATNLLNGTKYMLTTGGYQPRVAILPDGGDNWQIERVAKGWWHQNVRVAGKTAHGSRPWEGENAINKAMDMSSDLRTLFATRGPDTNTLNITMIEGGIAVNQIPDSATVKLDARIIDPALFDQERVQIEAIFKRYGATHTTIVESGPAITDLTNPFVQDFMTSVETITGETCAGSMSFGGSDAIHFTAAQIPCILVRPHGGGQHANSEWLDVQGFFQYKDILHDYLERVLNVSVSAEHEPTAADVLTPTE